MKKSLLRAFLLILCITLLLPLVSCSAPKPSDKPQEETPTADPTATPTVNPTVEPTAEPTAEPTQEPEDLNMWNASAWQNSEIGERYFIYRIWNFNITNMLLFKKTVKAAKGVGCNAIKIHIPWFHVEKTDGVYEYTAFDQMVEYVLSMDMKVAISIDLTRKAGDTLLSADCFQTNANGSLCSGGAYFDKMEISFASEKAVRKATAFFSDAVKHFEGKYAKDILFYLPAFSQYAETEYWCTDAYDYSACAQSGFRTFLQTLYPTIEELNAALGTNYEAFLQITPPAVSDSTPFGLLWYRYRHEILKGAIDGLADALHTVSPTAKMAAQFGSVFDSAIVLRGTMGFVDLCEKVDVLWVDDAPTYDHVFSMDYLRSNLPARIELAQEIDGPYQATATPERYLNQGLTCFERGCKYVSIANWSIDADFTRYTPTFQEISSTWIGKDKEIVPVTTQYETVTFKLSYLLSGAVNAQTMMDAYYALVSEKEFVRIEIIDDLKDYVP